MPIDTKKSSFANRPFFCSWSGGKDSCLALYRAVRHGGAPKALVTMIAAEGGMSRSHGLSQKLLNQQATALNIPLITCSTTWNDYEAKFAKILQELRQQGI